MGLEDTAHCSGAALSAPSYARAGRAPTVAGAVLALIAWVYYSAQVFFLGAEFTREYALRHGSQQGRDPIFLRPKEPGGA